MIIVKRKYIPTDASVIRTMALAKGLAELGCDVNLWYIQKNPLELAPSGQDHLKIECLSETCSSKSKLVCFMYGVISLVHRVKKGDKVLMACFVLPLFWLLSLLRIHLYHERTEYPPFMFHKSFWGRMEESVYIHICKRTEGVFVITNQIKDYFVNKGVSKDKIHVINMVVDSSRFKDLKKTEVKPYIAYCGTISNFKDGVDCLLKAFSIFHQVRPNVSLHIYGVTPSVKDREVNQKIISENHLEKVVMMPGRISSDEIPIRLTNAMALVLARPANKQSQYGFPTKLGEYLLTGNPVVVTRVGELDQYLEDRVSCVFARPNDPVDLAKQLECVFENKELATRIGETGRQVAINSFNYKTEALKISNVICK